MAQAEATPHYLWKTDKIESNLDYSFELPQQVTVRGQLVDEQGAPVSNASILVKGTNEGAKSDEEGKFSFQTGKAKGILVISHMSYETKEVPINTASQMKIVLIENSSTNIEEVVVTSFGIKRDRKTLGYGVAEVKADELSKAPTPDVTNALAGRLSGVQVSGAGGGFGGSNITIRGFSTFTGSNQPLYVVDGIPLDNSGGGNSVTPVLSILVVFRISTLRISNP